MLPASFGIPFCFVKAGFPCEGSQARRHDEIEDLLSRIGFETGCFLSVLRWRPRRGGGEEFAGVMGARDVDWARSSCVMFLFTARMATMR